ncbi:membrane protein [Dokdonia pacifica]|uniref:Periplasmic chaperone for outer membrane proteins Skp n=2 Tax=Dokdonia pacifica TaxID=1627892 RepID=A0A238WGG8_9FLAO|nr:membrane protein [Dokdonia pacifica]SNR45314.1 periplasmic chaperone for outer membrane proteins Skp [Dokdonia pacifica]
MISIDFTYTLRFLQFLTSTNSNFLFLPQNIHTMKKIGILVVVAFLSIACQTEKTAFVDTETLFKDYDELNDVKERYTKQNDAILNDLEVKIQAFEIKQNLFQKNGPSMSQKKQQEKYNELAAEAQQLQQERQLRLGKLQADSQGSIDSLLTKVKDKVKEYGKTNGYTYIYGSNDAGSVMYGKEELDITDSVLKHLNDAYKASKE